MKLGGSERPLLSLLMPAAQAVSSEARMNDVGLNTYNYRWDLRPDECPCDVQLVDWLDRNGTADAAIFHFGTGGHHHVGIQCAKPERRNAVLGITASPEEHAAFVSLAIERPDILRFYHCLFGDIYLLNQRLLPTFDAVTLFHLCEFRGEANEAYGAMTDLDVANLLADRTRPGGHILFYTGSNAFDRAREVIARWEKERDVEPARSHEALLVYRKRG